MFSAGGRAWFIAYRAVDSLFRRFDDQRLLMVEHLRLLPPARYRTPGQSALSEFGYSAGLMAAYLGLYLHTPTPHILDLGCGTGKMVSAAYPFIRRGGRYTGLDIDPWMIDFDQRWYPPEHCQFIHAPVYNAMYNPKGIPQHEYVIPLEDGSVDAALAFSLFTHLQMPDAQHYFRELARLLKPGGVALLTFFLIDDRFHPDDHRGTRWCFDRALDGQPEWRYPSYYRIPEAQIGVTPAGISLLMGDDFDLIAAHYGWWPSLNDAPRRGGWSGAGAMLQDTLVFRRKGGAAT